MPGSENSTAPTEVGESLKQNQRLATIKVRAKTILVQQ